MANTKELFIFSILFILLILDALIIKNEFSSFLEKLESNLESMNEEKSRLSRKYEEDVAELKKMIAEYDEMKGNKKIHSNQHMLESIKSMNEKSGFDLRNDEEDIAMLKKVVVEKDEIIDSKQNNKIHPNQEWTPTLKKIQFLNFKSNLKPHFDFLTSKTSEAYHVSMKAYHVSMNTLTTIVEKLQSSSINTLVTFVEKLQKSATQFIKELYKSAIPYIMKMSMWLLSVLVKGLNELLEFCLEAAR